MASNLAEQQLEEVVEDFLSTDYMLVAVTTMVVYDYVLQFPLEFELIWLRYLGLAYTASQILFNFSVPLSKVSDTSAFDLPSPTFYNTAVSLWMISIRIYVLFGREKKPLFVLAVFFVVSQGVNIALSALLLKVAVGSAVESGFLSFDVCTNGSIPNIQWLYPTSGSILIVYEAIICGFAVRYAFKNLGSYAWKNPVSCFNTLMAIIVRDNLVYFFIVFFQALVNVLAGTSKLESLALSCLDGALLTIVLAMVGPWMIISLRKNYERDVNGDVSEAHELSPVAFVTPDSRPDGDDEV
ncbi:hypothetical protein CONPUDRAFT_155519 [Coniophora puteana RWD-64-598 SS2]|uniref:DUF6533 domain-containing protein n=1 Tax=Coniophora puteana (strain RWD-64-598) TaxID=741705 RepID=A0A5M3MIP1_CONPW|nr:uncharacterized protein CONPUDRAFT_155519 [Coniophora puteana RWD-64-598 SS2]EIW78790.1 hypothetical protein CONPUDRAFT_155519 [Coniophora puteana RWD-64-598 SS2]